MLNGWRNGLCSPRMGEVEIVALRGSLSLLGAVLLGGSCRHLVIPIAKP